ncbi:MAG: hypothetical protein RML95_08615 [Anaerolineae bacterium]|nr:hypothetical protein [Anaerolineae bacterium]MDW8299389.1 hypothetical protein [Anaerolineae bacterium]
MTSLRLILLCTLCSLLVVACAPPPAPARTPTSRPVVPTRVPTRIVTLAPTATPLPTLTPTPPYALAPLLGEWLIDLSLQLREGITFDDVRFVGTLSAEVSLDSTLSGEAEFYAAVWQPPCVTAVLDPEPIRAKLSGKLQLAENGDVLALLRLQPENILQVTTLRLACLEFPEGIVLSEPIFWQAMRAADLIEFNVPLQVGYVRRLSADLSGISGGALYGTLYAELRVSR